jgi:hypothetical protein
VEAVIGPFQSSPLSLVPKEGKPDKFRAVYDFSHPHNPAISPPSINSDIDASNYPCTWGTFEMVCLIITCLPPESRASVRDVAAAYRTIPTHQFQWPGLVVQLKGKDSYAINTNNNFGLTSAGGVYGQLADAGVDLFRAEGIGPISKWVDDHVFFSIRCSTSHCTMLVGLGGSRKSKKMRVVFTKAAGYGIVERSCQTANMKNSMKIFLHSYRLFRTLLRVTQRIKNTATMAMTLALMSLLNTSPCIFAKLHVRCTIDVTEEVNNVTYPVHYYS